MNRDRDDVAAREKHVAEASSEFTEARTEKNIRTDRFWLALSAADRVNGEYAVREPQEQKEAGDDEQATNRHAVLDGSEFYAAASSTSTSTFEWPRSADAGKSTVCSPERSRAIASRFLEPLASKTISRDSRMVPMP